MNTGRPPFVMKSHNC